METGSATRVYKSSSCVGGTARGGAFPPPLFNCADREREARKAGGVGVKNILSKDRNEKLI